LLAQGSRSAQGSFYQQLKVVSAVTDHSLAAPLLH